VISTLLSPARGEVQMGTLSYLSSKEQQRGSLFQMLEKDTKYYI
jgi:hypothetical protein